MWNPHVSSSTSSPLEADVLAPSGGLGGEDLAAGGERVTPDSFLEGQQRSAEGLVMLSLPKRLCNHHRPKFPPLPGQRALKLQDASFTSLIQNGPHLPIRSSHFTLLSACCATGIIMNLSRHTFIQSLKTLNPSYPLCSPSVPLVRDAGILWLTRTLRSGRDITMHIRGQDVSGLVSNRWTTLMDGLVDHLAVLPFWSLQHPSERWVIVRRLITGPDAHHAGLLGNGQQTPSLLTRRGLGLCRAPGPPPPPQEEPEGPRDVMGYPKRSRRDPVT
ncbi:unnamed protein product [Boreogadus saida]